ncbi:MAG: hypothetical protein YK1312THETA_1810002 [Marine Group I thaumarchaeote]|nr:MAG: hypothetical protein YK1312THETA_1810002 [Marine Group I thaumarchaeote]
MEVLQEIIKVEDLVQVVIKVEDLVQVVIKVEDLVQVVIKVEDLVQVVKENQEGVEMQEMKEVLEETNVQAGNMEKSITVCVVDGKSILRFKD